MSHNPGITVHPNRVFVKELPVDVSREELMSAFSGFGLRLRAARVVETKGSTNYGFLTFDSKEEANEVLQRAKSDRGILVRGRKVIVDHAYSRRTPPRRNSRQFSQAFQGLCRSMNPEMDTRTEAQQHFMHQNYGYQYANQRCASPANQMHYPVQTSQHYNNICYDGRSVYMATQNPGLPSQQAAPGAGQNGHISFQHGNVHSSYLPAHHQGLAGQLYVENPAEGLEAPSMSEWCSNTESATVHCAEPESQATFHHHNQNSGRQMQSQLHHQTQLVQQHLAQQQSLLNAPWIQYAQYQHPSSPRGNSDDSNH